MLWEASAASLKLEDLTNKVTNQFGSSFQQWLAKLRVDYSGAGAFIWTHVFVSCCSHLLSTLCLSERPYQHNPGLGSVQACSQLGGGWLCINRAVSLLCSRAGSRRCTRRLRTARRTATCPCAPAALPPRPALTVPPTVTSPWALARPPSPSLSSALKNSPARCLSFPLTWSPPQWTGTSSLVGSVSPDLKCKAWGSWWWGHGWPPLIMSLACLKEIPSLEDGLKSCTVCIYLQHCNVGCACRVVGEWRKSFHSCFCSQSPGGSINTVPGFSLWLQTAKGM